MLATSTNIHFHGMYVPPKCHQDEIVITDKWGIYLTQVTPRCSIAFHGGLSAKSDRIRSPLLHREGMPGVFGPASVAGWFSLSTMRGAEGVVGE